MEKGALKSAFFISFAFIAILAFSAFSSAAGTSHGVNGYVDDCGSGVDVNGSNVTFELFNYFGPRGDNILNDTVGTGKANKSGWYAVDVGNFDPKPWNATDVVVINISNGKFSTSTSVILTGNGSDQAFTVCLGNATNFSCACGNGLCEVGPPFCENAEFKVNGIVTKRCPEDCSKCVCGNNICQVTDCKESMLNCPKDCDPGYCGDGICQSAVGENQELCPKDCGYHDSNKPNCGNGICEPQFEEDWQTCPNDCYGLMAHCGDGKCDGAETTDNCCLDCGCPPNDNCNSIKCINNKCQKTCCLFGYCHLWFGLCWFWWVAILITLILVIVAVIRKKKKISNAKKKLSQVVKYKK